MSLLQSIFLSLASIPIIILFVVIIQISISLLSNILKRLGPLARIPAPPISLHRAYTIGHGLANIFVNGDSINGCVQLNSWRKQCGSLFRLNSLFGEPNIMVMSDTAIRRFTIENPSVYHKSRLIHNSLASFIGRHGVFLAEGELHTRLRRFLSPALRPTVLKGLDETFIREGNRLVDRITTSTTNNDVDILRDVRISTFAVIFDACFGYDNVSPELVDRLRHDYLEIMLESPEHMLRRALLQHVFNFVTPEVFGFKEDKKLFIKNTVSMLCAEFRKNHEKGSDQTKLLSLMIDEETNEKIPLENMTDSLLSFLVAGQGTSSISVCWTLYLLARHEQWQRQLENEIAGWSPESGMEELDRMPILHRVIKESLRLYPPLLNTSRVLAEDDIIDGYHIPKGTVIRLPIMALQRNQDIWGKDADEFCPDRWLNEDFRKRMYWAVFLFGPRGCMGQKFAILEMKAFVALILRRFIISVDATAPEPRCIGTYGTPVGMKLLFQKRENV